MKNKRISDEILINFMMNAFRASNIEDLHRGITPTSKIGDFSDVKVITPYGEIPWNQLSRISDKEMGFLKDSIRKLMKDNLSLLKEFGLNVEASDKLITSFNSINK